MERFKIDFSGGRAKAEESSPIKPDGHGGSTEEQVVLERGGQPGALVPSLGGNSIGKFLYSPPKACF